MNGPRLARRLVVPRQCQLGALSPAESGNSTYPSALLAPQPSSKRKHEVIDLTDDAPPSTVRRDPPRRYINAGRGRGPSYRTNNRGSGGHLLSTFRSNATTNQPAESSGNSNSHSEDVSQSDSDPSSPYSSEDYPDIEDDQAALDVADRLASGFKSTYGPNSTLERPYPTAAEDAPWVYWGI